jgi:hypothetical protein
MPAHGLLGVPILIGCVLALGCEVQDQGLATPLPRPPGAPADPGPPASSIDPPAATASPATPDAAPAMPDPAPVPPIDEPTPVARDAGLEAATPDAAPVSAANCAALRTGPFSARLRNANIESDDLIFDPQGRMLLIRDGDIIRMADGMTEVLLSGVVGNQGGALRFLPDGSLVVGDFSGDEVTRYNLISRSQQDLANTDSPMKIALGPANRLYVSSNDGLIYLVNPATGQEQVVASPDGRVGGLAFSPDYRTLYAGLLVEDAVAAFPVRPQGQLGPRSTLARGIPFPYALAVDECGNVYSSGGPDGAVRRTRRTGQTETLVDVNREQLWGLAFGSGGHGFSKTALYLTSDSEGQPGLFEIEIGVAGAPPPPATTVGPN